MIRYLTLDEVVAIHAALIARYGGDPAVHDIRLVDSALAQPRQGFGGQDFFPTLEVKAAALGYFLTRAHGFKDGNKRVGFGAMDAFLRVNGFRIVTTPDDAEAASLAVADHRMTRDKFTEWVQNHVAPLAPPPGAAP